MSGLSPPLPSKKRPRADENTYAIVCGPPIMIKFTQPVLEKLGYAHDHIIMSLENRMKCGIGMCGRCNIGKEFVCKDGPVFTLDQLNQTPGNIEDISAVTIGFRRIVAPVNALDFRY